MGLFFAAALGAVAWSAAAAQTRQGLDDGPDPYARPLARTVVSLVEYSRWPAEREVIRLCVAGSSDHAGRLEAQSLSGGRALRPIVVPAASANAERCDVVYLGRLSLDEQRALTTQLLDAPVLTIAENDPACRGGAMVCLLFEADEMSFRINLDAISRSQVRVDPRVLRMSAGAGRN